MSENAVWNYPTPIDECPDIADYVAFYWDRVDAWYEEDEQIFQHARDPYTRIDCLTSSRHVEVLVNGVKVADTSNPVLLFETGRGQDRQRHQNGYSRRRHNQSGRPAADRQWGHPPDLE